MKRVGTLSTVSEECHDPFEKETFAHFVTTLPNGNPHSTSVWTDYDADDDRLLINTERERRKARNAAENPTVAVSMTGLDDPYRFLSVIGEVEEITTEGAREHIDELVLRYLGEEEYPHRSRAGASSSGSARMRCPAADSPSPPIRPAVDGQDDYGTTSPSTEDGREPSPPSPARSPTSMARGQGISVVSGPLRFPSIRATDPPE